MVNKRHQIYDRYVYSKHLQIFVHYINQYKNQHHHQVVKKLILKEEW